MRSEHASDLPDRHLQVGIALAEITCYSLRFLGRLRVDHAHVLHWHVFLEELDHPRDRAGSSANAVDGFDFELGDEQERLQVEHRAPHCLPPPHPPPPLTLAN